MLRIVMLFIRLGLYAPFWYITLRIYANTEKYPESRRYKFLRKMVTKIISKSRVDVICTGTENLPQDGSYMLFPNHQGLFDVLMIIKTHEKPVSAVVKKELMEIHLLKRVLRVLDVLSMDREDVRQSMKVIAETTKQVKEGRRFIIFAEGTRSKNGNNILPFKGGSFKAATKAGCPIVPVALIDSFLPFDVKGIKKCTTQVHYLKPIYPDEYNGMQTSEIAQIVHDRIEQTIKEKLK